ncbi:hypothetical protein F5Y08DRAFT_287730 [Xylaria arbuscula]|nr:hypothetical protein F5Y08DRAFT_287730 [Xylaria arbuscula]
MFRGFTQGSRAGFYLLLSVPFGSVIRASRSVIWASPQTQYGRYWGSTYCYPYKPLGTPNLAVLEVLPLYLSA